MAVIQVSLEDLGARLLADYEAQKAGLVKVIQDTVATEGLALVQQEIAQTQPPPVDRGGYRRAWKVARDANGATLFNSLAYAPIIEYGRRPGKFPPMGEIIAWVHRKRLARVKPVRVKRVRGVFGGVVNAYRKGQAQDRSRVQEQAAERRLAFVIARKIATRGIAGRFVLMRVQKKLSVRVMVAVDKFLKGEAA